MSDENLHTAQTVIPGREPLMGPIKPWTVESLKEAILVSLPEVERTVLAAFPSEARVEIRLERGLYFVLGNNHLRTRWVTRFRLDIIEDLSTRPLDQQNQAIKALPKLIKAMEKEHKKLLKAGRESVGWLRWFSMWRGKRK